MPTEPSDELLARYLAGEATADERDAIAQWEASSPARAAELVALREGWRQAGRSAHSWDIDGAWQRVAEATGDDLAVRRRLRRASGWMRIAAVLAVLAAGGVYWQRTRVASGGAETIRTVAAEQRTLILQDGSTVTLAPGSELVIAAGFGHESREVALRGEAWFVVAHDERRPFRVHAQGTIVEDLGTSFAIRALADEPRVRVVLVSGSASLRRRDDPIDRALILHPNDVGQIVEAGAPAIEHRPDVDDLVSWPDGNLIASNQPLTVLFADLTRWYGVRFTADSAMLARHLSATLPLRNLDEAVAIIRLALGAQSERRDSLIVFR